MNTACGFQIIQFVPSKPTDSDSKQNACWQPSFLTFSLDAYGFQGFVHLPSLLLWLLCLSTIEQPHHR